MINYKITFRFILLLLTAILNYAPSFGQGTSARAVADTFYLVPGVPRACDLPDNDTIPANDTIKSMKILLPDIYFNKVRRSDWVFNFSSAYVKGTREITGSYTLHTRSGDSSQVTSRNWISPSSGPEITSIPIRTLRWISSGW